MDNASNKAVLTIIQSTHASLGGFKQTGLFERHRRLLSEYSKAFHVVVYSCDEVDYSLYLGVEHHPVPWLPKDFGWRHLIFYLWLVWSAPQMQGVIKVFGSNIPTLPLVKVLSHCPMMVTYQWDYAGQTLMNEKKGLKSWLPGLLERLALGPADLVLVTADWLEQKVHRSYHKRTALLPNWVDLSNAAAVDSTTARDENTILFAGRLHWSKGVNFLIDALSLVKEQYPSVKLVICGEGEEKENLVAQAKSLLPEGIEFRGCVPNSEVLRQMKRASIFVLPTVTMEGNPKALIEAMACGAACLAADVPGNRDVVTNGDTGMLVPPSNARALAGALIALLGNLSLRQHVGRAARMQSTRYDFSTIVDREVRILLSLRGAC